MSVNNSSNFSYLSDFSYISDQLTTINKLSKDTVNEINSQFALLTIDPQGFDGFTEAMSVLKNTMAGIDFIKLALGLASITTEIIANTLATGANNTVKGIAQALRESEIGQMVISIGQNIQLIALYASEKVGLLAKNAALIAENAALIAKNAIQTVSNALQAAGNALMAANPIALVVIAIVALVAAFVLLWNKCEGFRNFFIGLWDNLKEVGAWLGSKFTAIWEGIGNVLSGLWDKLKEVGAWLGSKFAAIWEGLSKVITGVWDGIKTGLRSAINFVIKCINTYLKGILFPINLVIKGLNYIPGVDIKPLALTIPEVPSFASGGFPSTGQMFFAREAGPELVGTIGSRNAVVNNDQIIESVSAGVARAVSSVLGNGGSAQTIQVFIGNDQLDEYISNTQRRRSLQTNGVYA